ncbi:MAG: tetratricopeptide repeat protein, partial [Rhodospirillaceae bacterium]|nr:tetratricopeptide repeat protein [Rhodospirillaceae bacterium]
LKPGLAEAHAQHGLALMLRGEHANAIVDFGRALAIDPRNNAEVLLYRGNAYIQLGNLSAALADLENAVALMPNNPGAFQLRGLAYERMGRRRQAISDYREALKRFPQFGDALAGLRRLGETP